MLWTQWIFNFIKRCSCYNFSELIRITRNHPSKTGANLSPKETPAIFYQLAQRNQLIISVYIQQI